MSDLARQGDGLAVTVLGCDGSAPRPGGACSGYLLQGGGTAVWLDAGTGTLANLQRHLDVEDLDAVVLSHRHVDHWTDVESLAVIVRWIKPRRPVPVYAPEGLRGLARLDEAEDALVWHEVAAGDRVEIGALRLSFSQTDHPVTTLAVRVDCNGRSLGYSADTGPGWALRELGQGLNLALCEATFLSPDEGRARHLSARQAGESARQAEVERLVVTHLSPRVDPSASRSEASEAFGADVEMAASGARFEA